MREPETTACSAPVWCREDEDEVAIAHDDRIDAYIEQAEPFAQPILRHLRHATHAAVPGLGEAIKWGRPFFMLDERPFAMMAAFKGHAIYGFWQGGDRAVSGKAAEAGGQFGRITTLADLPDDAVLAALIRAAAGERLRPSPPVRKPPRPLPAVPPELTAALAENEAAAHFFQTLSPGRRRDYLEWIIEAQRPETKARRIARTVEQLAQEKPLR